MRNLLAFAAMTAAAAFAQAPPAPPAFEVASVKPAPPQGEATGLSASIGLYTYPGGRILATNYTLRMLIHDAYDLEMYRITGGPHWADEARFEIEAKPPAASPSSHWAPASFKTPPNPEMRLMLRSLLAERFQLQVHQETRKETVYVLVQAARGARLKEPATDKQPFVSFGRTGDIHQAAITSVLTGRNATMDLLAERLAGVLRRSVDDRTGLPGHYDFQVEYAADESQADAAPSLFRALQDQLGLRLESRPGTTTVLVIDRAEKPSGN